MLYKFRSKATGDVIMLQTNGDEVLRLLGREPAPKGIFEHADQLALVSALEAAVQRAESPADDDDAAGAERRVGLRQRVWPLVEMLRRAHAAREPVVWGV